MTSTPEIIQLDLNGRAVRVEVYHPAGNSAVPGILYLHEIYGVIDAYREDARELASQGYLVYLPDLYSNGFAGGYCLRAAVHAAGRRNAVSNPLFQEIAALIRLIRSAPRCNGKLGMIGMCLTGGFVIQAAMREGVEAPVIYHHSLGLHGAGIPGDEEADLINVSRLQGHWSRIDPFCPARRRHRLKQLLGERLDDYVYDIPHGFRSLARSTESAALAWQRTSDFFAQHLGLNTQRITATDV